MVGGEARLGKPFSATDVAMSIEKWRQGSDEFTPQGHWELEYPHRRRIGSDVGPQQQESEMA
eukprot:69839-Rhodomonas_salina.1